jgi:hypothetical protein
MTIWISRAVRRWTHHPFLHLIVDDHSSGHLGTPKLLLVILSLALHLTMDHILHLDLPLAHRPHLDPLVHLHPDTLIHLKAVLILPIYGNQFVALRKPSHLTICLIPIFHTCS